MAHISSFGETELLEDEIEAKLERASQLFKSLLSPRPVRERERLRGHPNDNVLILFV